MQSACSKDGDCFGWTGWLEGPLMECRTFHLNVIDLDVSQDIVIKVILVGLA